MATLEAPSTFAAVWERSVDRRADSLFLMFEGSDCLVSSWTYEQFDGLVSRVAAT